LFAFPLQMKMQRSNLCCIQDKITGLQLFFSFLTIWELGKNKFT
jgi:hypothetical protein